MKNLLDVHKVFVKFQNQIILDQISFSLAYGSNLAIIGTAGSGKTTLLKALMGKIHYQGNIHFNSIVKNQTAYVPQQHQFTNKSNTTTMYYQQRFNALDADDSITVREALGSKFESNLLDLQFLQLSENFDQPILQLSNGEHKKLQLAI